jgi:glutathione S-transferase
MVTRASELSRVRRRAVSPASTASPKMARRFGRRVGKRRLLAFDGVRVERCACALERGLDRLRRRLEDRGGFVGGEAEHVAQHERCALLRRQLLQRDDERELDRFALLVACFRSGSGIRKRAVRVRLEPAGLDGAAGS